MHFILTNWRLNIEIQVVNYKFYNRTKEENHFILTNWRRNIDISDSGISQCSAKYSYSRQVLEIVTWQGGKK